MQNTSWISLIRLIPSALHNQLALTTTIGLEIAVQDIFRLEEEYMVVRGRLSGTMDSGRIFIIPYDQVNYIGLQKLLKQQEIEAVFGGTYSVATPAQATPAPEAEAPPEPAPPEEPPTIEVAPPAAAATPPPEKKPAHSRFLLLQRVRARLAAASKSKLPGGS